MSPMDQEDEGDFPDDGLDQLPQSTLHDLENNAISSTQHRIAAMRQRQHKQLTRPLKLSAPSNGWQQMQPSSEQHLVTAPAPAPAPAPAAPALEGTSPPSSDYGLDDEDDEEIVDLANPLNLQSDVPQTGIQPTSDRRRLPQNVSFDETSAPVAFEQEPLEGRPVDHVAPDAVSHPDLDHLAAQIDQLKSELAMANLSLQNAQATNQKQAGEISIIRAKQDKDAKDYESKIAVLQKMHADETAKQKKNIEVFETDNRFLKHDLAQARVEGAKRHKPTVKNGLARIPLSRTGSHNNAQPSQNLPYRDGFDDHEILLSPSKPRDRTNPPTPKAGEKRKRNVTVSPAPSLHLNHAPSTTPPSVANTGDLVVAKEVFAQAQEAQDLQFQMIQRLMNHRPLDSQERVLETLSRLAFPSLPDKSIAGIVAEALSLFTSATEERDFPSYVCSFLSDLWAKCLLEEFYAPVYLLLDLYEFVLAISLKVPEISLVERFIPLATKTIDLIAVPRARPALDLDTNHHPKPESKIDEHLLEFIDVDQTLSLLHSLAFDANISAEAGRVFWRTMEFDFTLMMLNKAQPLPHIMLVLQMVASSAMPESFGVIADNPDRQSFSEVHTIDRLTTLLFERPEAPADEDPYEDSEIANLQIETIRTLNAIAITKHGSVVLAQHRTAIGRLIRLIHVQITKLYDLPPSRIEVIDDKLTSAEASPIHELTATLINLTVRLIYHLLTNYADHINLREKLMVIPGGHHKFLVSLTRLAFSEQLVYEAGIEEEAVDAAHEILDGILSPEEGEAVVQAIETPRGTTATRASAPR